MSNVPITPADLERLKETAHQLAVTALESAGDHPLAPWLALAALTTASSQIAIVTDTSFAQLMELVTIHFQAAAVGVAVQELEAQLGQKFTNPKIVKEPS